MLGAAHPKDEHCLPGRHQGSSQPTPAPAALAPALGTEKAQEAQRFWERGVALSILLADVVLEVSTPNSPPRSSMRFCTRSLSQKQNYRVCWENPPKRLPALVSRGRL